MIERWNEAKLVLERLWELPAAAQEAKLRELEAGDPDLARIVRELVARDQELAEEESVGGAQREDAAAETSARPSRRAVGRFLLRHRIATGRSSSVWWAARNDGAFDQDVAVKVIDTDIVARDLGVDPSRAAGHERRLLARVDSPHVVRLVDAGELDGTTEWLALELLDAEPIFRYCDRMRLPIRERIRIFAGAAQGVADAHAAGVLHLDLAPTNVLVTGAGVAKVIDFGSGRRVDDDSLPGRAAATPSFAAPERFRDGGRASRLADVWSLGALLYELVSGVPPIDVDAVSMAEARRRRLSEDPLSPARRLRIAGADVAEAAAVQRGTTTRALTQTLRSGGLDAVVLSAVQREESRRTESVQDLVEDLNRWLRGEPVRAKRETLTQRVTRLARYRPKVALAAGVIAASLAVGASSLWIGAREARAAAREVTRVEKLEQERLHSTRVATDLLVRELFDALVPQPGTFDAIGKLLDAGVQLAEAAPEDEVGLLLADAIVKRAGHRMVTPRWTRSIAESALRDCDRAEALIAPVRVQAPRLFTAARIEWTIFNLRSAAHFELCDLDGFRRNIAHAKRLVDDFVAGIGNPIERHRVQIARMSVRAVEGTIEEMYGQLGVLLSNTLESLDIAEELVAEAPHIDAVIEARISMLRITAASLTYAERFLGAEPAPAEAEQMLESALGMYAEMVATIERSEPNEKVLDMGATAASELSRWLIDVGRVEESDRVLTRMRALVAAPGTGAGRRPSSLESMAILDTGSNEVMESQLGARFAGTAYIVRSSKALRDGDPKEALRFATRARTLFASSTRTCPDRVTTKSHAANVRTYQGRALEAMASAAEGAERVDLLTRAVSHFREVVEIVDDIDGDEIFQNRNKIYQDAAAKDLRRCLAKLQ